MTLLEYSGKSSLIKTPSQRIFTNKVMISTNPVMSGTEKESRIVLRIFEEKQVKYTEKLGKRKGRRKSSRLLHRIDYCTEMQ